MTPKEASDRLPRIVEIKKVLHRSARAHCKQRQRWVIELKRELEQLDEKKVLETIAKIPFDPDEDRLEEMLAASGCSKWT